MHPGIGKAVGGGFVGTLAMSMMMYLVAPMMGLNMDVAAMLGGMLGIGWTGGMLMHFVNGTIVFPLIYVFALYSRLPGNPALKGTTWGLILWLVAQVVVMPMAGAGLFSAAMGGMMAAAGSLVGHVLYGAVLGVIAGEAVRTRPATLSSSRA
ncbi:MAG: hypothetical protein HY657_06085 [Acidobacteria bacterium]|nr:hypothetical protein [Acidobacteriota bacterium]